MEISVYHSTHKIALSSSDAYNIACDTYYAIKSACESHWVKYPDKFHKDERERLDRLKLFLGLGNYSFLYDSYIKEFNTIIGLK